MSMLPADFHLCAQNGSEPAATLKNTKAAPFRFMTTDFFQKLTRNPPTHETGFVAQLSTLNHQPRHRVGLCALAQVTPSRSFGTRARESSRPKWSSSRSAKMEDRRPACPGPKMT